MSDHDSSLYVPSDDGRVPALHGSQVHAAQLTVVEYAERGGLPRAELVGLLDMLGIGERS